MDAVDDGAAGDVGHVGGGSGKDIQGGAKGGRYRERYRPPYGRHDLVSDCLIAVDVHCMDPTSLYYYPFCEVGYQTYMIL